MCATRNVRVKHIFASGALARSIGRTDNSAMPDKLDPTPYQAFLADWRMLRGMTLEAVAEKLDVAHSTVSRWERGDLPISSRRLVDLCRLYQVTPEQLLSSPEAAEASSRTREIRELVEGIDDETFDHLRFVARRIKGAP